MNTKETPIWVDGLLLVIVLAISGAALVYDIQTGVFTMSLTNDSLLSWHLVRSAGLTAYALVGLSTVWGLFLSSRLIKDWTPGPVSLLLHATTSWLAVVLGIAHVGLLLWDTYYHYTIADLLIPFIGPYRPLAVGLGTISAWLILAITISFSLRKLIGQRNWRLLHYTSYATFVLITVHALMAGTDASKVGMQILVTLFTVAIGVIFVLRVTRRSQKTAAPRAQTQRQLSH